MSEGNAILIGLFCWSAFMALIHILFERARTYKSDRRDARLEETRRIKEIVAKMDAVKDKAAQEQQRALVK